MPSELPDHDIGDKRRRRHAAVEQPRPRRGLNHGALAGFAFGRVTGAFADTSPGDATAFDWDGNDEMDEVSGDGWAELLPDGSLAGGINFHYGDEITFTARRWATSSTAC